MVRIIGNLQMQEDGRCCLGDTIEGLRETTPGASAGAGAVATGSYFGNEFVGEGVDVGTAFAGGDAGAISAEGVADVAGSATADVVDGCGMLVSRSSTVKLFVKGEDGPLGGWEDIAGATTAGGELGRVHRRRG